MYSFKKVDKTQFGRRIAIGDIHGCFYTFKELVESKIKLETNDQLFILGDLIDRGSNSSMLLDYLLKLINSGHNIYPIMGNHEEKFLMSYNCGFDFFEEYLRQYNSYDLFNGNLEVYLEFISNFEYCIELDNFLLSHPGINEENICPSNDLRGMFPNIDFRFEVEKIETKIQVQGHRVSTAQKLKEDIQLNKTRLSIDTGCVHEGIGLGMLTGLDLDCMHIYQQACIDK